MSRSKGKRQKPNVKKPPAFNGNVKCRRLFIFMLYSLFYIFNFFKFDFDSADAGVDL